MIQSGTHFVADNAKGGGVLVFGRITYEPMASFWPTAQAMRSMPVVAERMNNLHRDESHRSWQGKDDVRGRRDDGLKEGPNALDARRAA